MSFKQTVVRGWGWSSIEQWGRQFTNFAVFLVLSRLLGPEAFALVGLAGIFVFLGETLTELGFGTALVQRKTADSVVLSTTLWIGLGVAVVLTLIGMASAGLVAQLFSEPRLAPVLRVLSLQFVLAGLSTVQESVLLRKMAFRSLAIRANLATFISGAVGIAMAFAGYGVWSLVAQRLLAFAVSAIVLWTASDWRPSFVFSFGRARELASFGAPVVTYKFLGEMNQQSNQFLIGYFLGTLALGYYIIGFRIVVILLQLLTNVTMRVALPTFSRLQDDFEKLRGAFFTATRLTSLVSFPVFVGLALVAPEAVPVMFGSEWIPSIPIVRLLALLGAIQSITFFNAPIIVAVGRPVMRLLQLILHIVVNVGLFFLVYPLGLTAVTFVFVARAYLLAPFDVWLVRRVTGFSARGYLRQFVGPTVATLLMAAAVLVLKRLVGPHVSLAFALPLYVGVGGVSYTAAIALLAPELFGSSLDLIRTLLGRRRTKEPPGVAPTETARGES